MTDFSSVNLSCLGAFGQSLTLTRLQTGESISFTGILDSGLELENAQPGEGVYARCFASLASLVTLPDKGDEIATSTTVYKIVQQTVDTTGAATMILRKDRDV